MGMCKAAYVHQIFHNYILTYFRNQRTINTLMKHSKGPKLTYQNKNIKHTIKRGIVMIHIFVYCLYIIISFKRLRVLKLKAPYERTERNGSHSFNATI